MKDIIKSLDKNKIASFYDNKSDTSGYYCGKIQYSDDTYVLLSHYNPHGYYSGYVLLKIENIFRINQEGKYENKLEYLSSLIPTQHNHNIGKKGSIIQSLLQFALDEKLILLIELCESDMDDVQGFVLDFDDENLSLECVDDYGQKDGKSTIYLHDISVIKCDTNHCDGVKKMIGLNK